jgi:hypothetical protein
MPFQVAGGDTIGIRGPRWAIISAILFAASTAPVPKINDRLISAIDTSAARAGGLSKK